MKDTVAKSPGFKLIRVDYMAALMARGDLEEAKNQYHIAQAIPSVGYLEALDINMAAICVREGKYEEADKFYNQAIFKTKGNSVVVYEAYISFLQELYAIRKGSVKTTDYRTLGKLIENLEKLYLLKKDPMLLYRLGQLSMSQADCKGALRYFEKARNAFPAQSEYALYSSKLFNQLASGSCRCWGSL